MATYCTKSTLATELKKQRVNMTTSINITIIGTILRIFYIHNLEAVYRQ